jgi:transcriptional regulator with XRE-family HTH domain
MKSTDSHSVPAHLPDVIDVEVGLAIRRARVRLKLSQTDLGRALGISFQQIQKYERGANRVSASMLVKAARFLNVSAADLLPPDDAPPTPAIARRFTEVRGVEELVDAYCALPQSAQRRAVLELVTAMTPGKAPVLEDAAD